jgi:uncharacterized protein
MRVDKLARLMPGLPKFIEPQRLADQAQTLSGDIPLADMPRLGELLCDTDGAVAVRLNFGRNEHGQVHIGGDYRVSLGLICQRCLKPLKTVQAKPVDVTVMAEGQPLDLVEGGSEPITLTGEKLHLAGFIEDEVLLGLPIAPRHETGACRAAGGDRNEKPVRRPFAALKTLMRK